MQPRQLRRRRKAASVGGPFVALPAAVSHEFRQAIWEYRTRLPCGCIDMPFAGDADHCAAEAAQGQPRHSRRHLGPVPRPPNLTTRRQKTDIPTLLSADILALLLQALFADPVLWNFGCLSVLRGLYKSVLEGSCNRSLRSSSLPQRSSVSFGPINLDRAPWKKSTLQG
jgi:hypothetical protein